MPAVHTVDCQGFRAAYVIQIFIYLPFHSVILHLVSEIELIINYDSRSTRIAFVDLRIIYGNIFCRPGSVDVDMHLRFLGSVPDPLQLLKAALQTGYLNGIPVQKTLVRHYNGSGK